MANASYLNFGITADETPMAQALERANALAQQSADRIARSFAEISAPFDAAVARLGSGLQSAAATLYTAFSGGGDGIGAAIVKGFDDAKSGALDLANFAEKEITSRLGIVGKVIDLAWTASQPTVTAAVDSWSKSLAGFANTEIFYSGKFDGIVKEVDALSKSLATGQVYLKTLGDNALEAFKNAPDVISGASAAMKSLAMTGLKPTEQNLAAIDAAALNASTSIRAIGAAAQTALQGLAGFGGGFLQGLTPTIDISGVTKKLNSQINAQERQNRLIGKSPTEAAKLRAEWSVADALGDDDAKQPTGPQKTALADLTSRLAALTAQGEAEKSAIRQAEQTKNLVAYVQQQAALQEAQTAEAGKTAGEVARQRVEAQTNLRITKEHLDLTAAQRIELEKQYAILEASANVRASAAFNKQLDEAGVSSVQQQALALDLLGAKAGDVAKVRFEMSEIAKLQQQGIPLTAELSDRITGWGEAIRRATDLAEAGKARLQELSQVGQIASSTLETAWSRWTKGASVSWQSLVDGMLQDIEKLVFKMYVLQPLFGGGTSGTGVIGQIAGAISGQIGGGGAITTGWDATVVATGGRALGGDVDPGRVYEVGENGRELFMPRVAGSIIPAGAGFESQRPVTEQVTNVIITAPSGMTARETGRSQGADGALNLEILLEQIEGAIGQHISDGSSPVGQAVQSRFGLSAAAGAR